MNPTDDELHVVRSLLAEPVSLLVRFRDDQYAARRDVSRFLDRIGQGQLRARSRYPVMHLSMPKGETL